MTEPPRLQPRLPRHAKTAAAIGRQIMRGDLVPGAVLPNAALLAREMRLSRPSLREAIKILAAKGLLSASPRRGTIVRPRSDWNRLDHDVLAWEAEVAPTPRFMRDLFEIRRMVEPEAAALAAERADQDGLDEIAVALEQMATFGVRTDASVQADLVFHRAVLKLSGNEILATFAPAIEACLRVAFQTQRTIASTGAEFVPQHREIYDAIRSRQPDLARERTLAHLKRAEREAFSALPVSAETD